MIDLELRLNVADFYARHAECICDGQIDQWPDFFRDDCLYRVVPRTNYERKLPIGPIFSESRGALQDRVIAIKETMVHASRAITHNVSSVRIVSVEGPKLRTRSMVSVYQTLIDGTTRLLLTGRSFDILDNTADALKFAERVVVFDSELLAGALVYPV